jgi:hypothetical protein
VKVVVDTLLTVPDAPPAAGPDRAFDPPPTALLPAGAAEGDVAGADDAPHAASTTPALTSVATMTHRLLVIGRRRRSLGGVSRGVVRSYSFMMALLFTQADKYRVAAAHVRFLGAAR